MKNIFLLIGLCLTMVVRAQTDKSVDELPDVGTPAGTATQWLYLLDGSTDKSFKLSNLWGVMDTKDNVIKSQLDTAKANIRSEIGGSGSFTKSGHRVYLTDATDSVGLGTSTPQQPFWSEGNMGTAGYVKAESFYLGNALDGEISMNYGREMLFTDAVNGTVALGSLIGGGGMLLYDNTLHYTSSAGDTGVVLINNGAFNTASLYIKNQGTLSGRGIEIENSCIGQGINIDNTNSGQGVNITNTNTGSAFYIFNSSISSGTGLGILNTGSGLGIDLTNSGKNHGLKITNSNTYYGEYITNGVNGTGLYIANSSTGKGIQLNNTSTGPGILINQTGNGKAIQVTNGVNYIFEVGKDAVYFSYLQGAEDRWLRLTSAGALDTGTLKNSGFMLNQKLLSVENQLKDQQNGEIAWYHKEGDEVIKTYGIEGLKPWDQMQAVMAKSEELLRDIYRRVLIDNIQWVLIGLLFAGLVYQQFQIARLKR